MKTFLKIVVVLAIVSVIVQILQQKGVLDIEPAINFGNLDS